jgi:hypothetical protein
VVLHSPIFVKLLLNGQVEYGEVQFYFLSFAIDSDFGSPTPNDSNKTLVAYALVSVYSRPMDGLLNESSGTLWACQYTGNGDLQVVEVSKIVSCVSMQPLPPLPNDPPGLVFVLEKSGLEDLELTGFEEGIDDNSGEV